MSTCKPLWEKYPGQNEAQPAYVQICEDGEIFAASNAEIGNAVPESVWNGRDQRFEISNQLSNKQIEVLLEELKPLVADFANCSEVDWDNSNHRRKITDEKAWEILMGRIESICESYEPDEWEHCENEDCEYCNQD
jgi:hypothetical protein